MLDTWPEVLACYGISVELDCRMPPTLVHVQPADLGDVVRLTTDVTTRVAFHTTPEPHPGALLVDEPIRLTHNLPSLASLVHLFTVLM